MIKIIKYQPYPKSTKIDSFEQKISTYCSTTISSRATEVTNISKKGCHFLKID